jgi:hypothetical protein
MRLVIQRQIQSKIATVAHRAQMQTSCPFKIRPATIADAVFLPAIENAAGSLFRTLPNLAHLADEDDLSVERDEHDPLCLRGMASHEVPALRRIRRRDPAPDALPEVVEPLTTLPAIDMLTVEQSLTSVLFDLFSTDAPDIEESLAQTGDLLALERAGALQPDAVARLAALRAKLQQQVIQALPVGSTRVERLVQDAVETYLRKRRETQADGLQALNETRKSDIVAALERL